MTAPTTRVKCGRCPNKRERIKLLQAQVDDAKVSLMTAERELGAARQAMNDGHYGYANEHLWLAQDLVKAAQRELGE